MIVIAGHGLLRHRLNGFGLYVLLRRMLGRCLLCDFIDFCVFVKRDILHALNFAAGQQHFEKLDTQFGIAHHR